MDKKHQKLPKNGGFPPFVTPKIFFKNQALSLLYPYGALTSCKKLEKANEQSLRYLKTDHRRTKAITKDPLGKPGVQNYIKHKKLIFGWTSIPWQFSMVLEFLAPLDYFKVLSLFHKFQK